MEESAKRLLSGHLSDTESVASGRSNMTDIPYMVQIPPAKTPEMVEEYISIAVVHVEEPNHFWYHKFNEETKRNFKYEFLINNIESRLINIINKFLIVNVCMYL